MRAARGGNRVRARCWLRGAGAHCHEVGCQNISRDRKQIAALKIGRAAVHFSFPSTPCRPLSPGTIYSSAEAMTAPRPHIVTIIADDYGWTNIGFHTKSAEVATPSMDSLAAGGVILDRHYAYSICSPSRSAFQSGRLSVHVNDRNAEPVVHNPADPIGGYAGIPRNMTGVAELMRRGGYKTHFTGKCKPILGIEPSGRPNFGSGRRPREGTAVSPSVVLARLAATANGGLLENPMTDRGRGDGDASTHATWSRLRLLFWIFPPRQRLLESAPQDSKPVSPTVLPSRASTVLEPFDRRRHQRKEGCPLQCSYLLLCNLLRSARLNLPLRTSLHTFAGEKIVFLATGTVDVCGNRFVDLWEDDAPAASFNGTAYEEELFTRRT